MSEAECLAKAQVYYSLAGGTLPLHRERSYFENGEFSHPQYLHAVFKFAAPGTPWKFEDGVETIIDRTYGTPMHMWIGQPPQFEAPNSVVPPESALAAGASAAALYTGWPEVMPAAPEPKFRIPGFAQFPNRMRAIEQRRAREGKAALFYEVTVKDALAVVEDEKHRPFVWVHVDAESGEPIAIYPAYQLLGGHPQTKPGTFTWSGRTWRSGKAVGKIATSSKAPPAKGKPVGLSSGRSQVLAQFDAKAKVVWVKDRGKILVGVPDSKLLIALSEAKPIRSYPMKKGQPAAGPSKVD